MKLAITLIAFGVVAVIAGAILVDPWLLLIITGVSLVTAGLTMETDNANNS